MSDRWPPIMLALLLVGVLALAITGYMRDLIIIPLLYFFWGARLLYESIPQTAVWGCFLVIAVLVVARSLPRLPAAATPQSPAPAPQERLAPWARLLRQSERDGLARWRLAQRLGILAQDVLAYHEQDTPQRIRRRVEDGSQPIPPDIRAYLRAGMTAYQPTRRSRRRLLPLARLGLRREAAPADPLGLDPEQVVRLLEETLSRPAEKVIHDD